MSDKKSQKYFEAVGRRKTAVARARLSVTSKASWQVNERTLEEYFLTQELRDILLESLKVVPGGDKYAVSLLVKGGGSHAQAEACRLAICRALVEANHDDKKIIKDAGLLTRDARAKERRKFGLKKARKAPQWSKR